MARSVVRVLLIGSLLLLALALWRKDILPNPQVLRQELLAEPQQAAIERAAFETSAGGVTYSVQPLYTYDLYGLVVSRHDSDTWWDYIHREWNDHLNVVDLCVLWGNNVRNGAYKDIDFSSGQFVCNFYTSSRAAYEAFDQAAISNNHLLSNDKHVARTLRAVRVGDQVHFRGFLSEYSHGGGFKRGTSIVRTDSGNGACETVFVEDVEILQAGGGPWRKLVWVAVCLLVIGIAGWLWLPAKFDN